MKKINAVLLLLSLAVTAIADEPGKAVNHPCKISFQHIAMLKDYTCYWKTHYDTATVIVDRDASLEISGSAGAPDGADFWAVNNNTKKPTDTINFSNYYSPDIVVNIDSIVNNHIQHTQMQLSNANKVVEIKDTAQIENKVLVQDAVSAEKKSSRTILWLSIVSAAAIGVLVILFFRKKKQ